MTYPHHFPHQTHVPSGIFSTHESHCAEYQPTKSSADVQHPAQHISSPQSPSSSHARTGCCACCDRHQSASNCLQYISASKSSASTCEHSPLDLSVASATTGTSLGSEMPLQQGHCPGPLCCATQVLLLRTSAPHAFAHLPFTHKTSFCSCSKSVICENSGAESVLCTSKSDEKNSQILQLASDVVVQSSPTTHIPPGPSANAENQDGPQQLTDGLMQAKLEKSLSPKQSSKTPSPKKRQFAHGWSWKGKPREKLISLSNEATSCCRMCYPSIQHQEGDVISERDCVLLKSGPKETDLPYVAKVTALWENPDDGEMMMSLLWYYRPEHTDQGRKEGQMEDEVFASRHRDVNSIACIEDKCYVLTFNEYCRYRSSLSMDEDSVSLAALVVPELPDPYARKNRLPAEAMASDIIFFCRHVYDFRQRRILKNPT